MWDGSPGYSNTSLAAATAKLGASLGDGFLGLFPAATSRRAARSADDLIGDEVISYQTWAWAWAVAQQRSGKSPAYVYHFDHRSAFRLCPGAARPSLLKPESNRP